MAGVDRLIWPTDDATTRFGKSSWTVTSDALKAIDDAGGATAARNVLLNEGARSTQGLGHESHFGNVFLAQTFLDQVLSSMGVAAPLADNATLDDYRHAAVLINFPLNADGTINRDKLWTVIPDGDDELLVDTTDAERKFAGLTAEKIATFKFCLEVCMPHQATGLEAHAYHYQYLLEQLADHYGLAGDAKSAFIENASEQFGLGLADDIDLARVLDVVSNPAFKQSTLDATAAAAYAELSQTEVRAVIKFSSEADEAVKRRGLMKAVVQAKVAADVADNLNEAACTYLSTPALNALPLADAGDCSEFIRSFQFELDSQKARDSAAFGADFDDLAIESIQRDIAADQRVAICAAVRAVNLGPATDAQSIQALVLAQLSAPSTVSAGDCASLFVDDIFGAIPDMDPPSDLTTDAGKTSYALYVANHLQMHENRDNLEFIARQEASRTQFLQLAEELSAPVHALADPSGPLQSMLALYRDNPDVPREAALAPYFDARAVPQAVRAEILQEFQANLDLLHLMSTVRSEGFRRAVALALVDNMTPAAAQLISSAAFVDLAEIQKMRAIQLQVIESLGGDRAYFEANNDAVLQYLITHLDPALPDADMSTIAGQNAYFIQFQAALGQGANATLLAQINAFQAAGVAFNNTARAVLDGAVREENQQAVYEAVNGMILQPIPPGSNNPMLTPERKANAIYLSIVRHMAQEPALMIPQINALFATRTFGELPRVPGALNLAQVADQRTYAIQVANHIQTMAQPLRENLAFVAQSANRAAYLELMTALRDAPNSFTTDEVRAVLTAFRRSPDNTISLADGFKTVLAKRGINNPQQQAQIEAAVEIANPTTLADLTDAIANPEVTRQTEIFQAAAALPEVDQLFLAGTALRDAADADAKQRLLVRHALAQSVAADDFEVDYDVSGLNTLAIDYLATHPVPLPGDVTTTADQIQYLAAARTRIDTSALVERVAAFDGQDGHPEFDATAVAIIDAGVEGAGRMRAVHADLTGLDLAVADSAAAIQVALFNKLRAGGVARIQASVLPVLFAADTLGELPEIPFENTDAGKRTCAIQLSNFINSRAPDYKANLIFVLSQNHQQRGNLLNLMRELHDGAHALPNANQAVQQTLTAFRTHGNAITPAQALDAFFDARDVAPVDRALLIPADAANPMTAVVLTSLLANADFRASVDSVSGLRVTLTGLGLAADQAQAVVTQINTAAGRELALADALAAYLDHVLPNVADPHPTAAELAAIKAQIVEMAAAEPFEAAAQINVTQLNALLSNADFTRRVGFYHAAIAHDADVAAQPDILRARVKAMVAVLTLSLGDAEFVGDSEIQCAVLGALSARNNASDADPVVTESARAALMTDTYLGDAPVIQLDGGETQDALILAEQITGVANHANLIRVAAEAGNRADASPERALTHYFMSQPEPDANGQEADPATADSALGVIRASTMRTPLAADRQVVLVQLLQSEGPAVFDAVDVQTEAGRRKLSVWLSVPANLERCDRYVTALNALENLDNAQAACRLYADHPTAFGDITVGANRDNLLTATRQILVLRDDAQTVQAQQAALTALINSVFGNPDFNDTSRTVINQAFTAEVERTAKALATQDGVVVSDDHRQAALAGFGLANIFTAVARVRALQVDDSAVARSSAARQWAVEFAVSRVADGDAVETALRVATHQHLNQVTMDDARVRPVVTALIQNAGVDSELALHVLPQAQRTDAQTMATYLMADHESMHRMVGALAGVEQHINVAARLADGADVPAVVSTDRIQTKILAALRHLVSNRGRLQKPLEVFVLSQIDMAQFAGVTEAELTQRVLKAVADQYLAIRSVEALINEQPYDTTENVKLRTALATHFARQHPDGSDAQKQAAVQGAVVSEHLLAKVETASENPVLIAQAVSLRGGDRLPKPLSLITRAATGADLNAVVEDVADSSGVSEAARAAVLKAAENFECAAPVAGDFSQQVRAGSLTLAQYMDAEKGRVQVRKMIADALGVSDLAGSPNAKVDLVFEALMAAQGGVLLQTVTDGNSAQFNDRNKQVAQLVIAGLAGYPEISAPDAAVVQAILVPANPPGAPASRALYISAERINAYAHLTTTESATDLTRGNLAAMQALATRGVARGLLSNPDALRFMSLSYSHNTLATEQSFTEFAGSARTQSRVGAARADRSIRDTLLAQHVASTLRPAELRRDAQRVQAVVMFAGSVLPAMPGAAGGHSELFDLQEQIVAQYRPAASDIPSAQPSASNSTVASSVSSVDATQAENIAALSAMTSNAVNLRAVYVRMAQLHKLPAHLMSAAAKQYAETNKNVRFENTSKLFESIRADLGMRHGLVSAIRAGLSETLAATNTGAPAPVALPLTGDQRTQMYSAVPAERQAVHDSRLRALRAQIAARMEAKITADLYPTNAAGEHEAPSHPAPTDLEAAEIKQMVASRVAAFSSLKSLDINTVNEQLLGTDGKYFAARETVITAMKFRKVFLSGRAALTPALQTTVEEGVVQAISKSGAGGTKLLEQSSSVRGDWLQIALTALAKELGIDVHQMNQLMGVDSLIWDPRLVGASGNEEKLKSTLKAQVVERFDLAKTLHQNAVTGLDAVFEGMGCPADKLAALKAQLVAQSITLPTESATPTERAQFALQNYSAIQHLVVVQKSAATATLDGDTSTPQGKVVALNIMLQGEIVKHPALAHLSENLKGVVAYALAQKLSSKHDAEWKDNPAADLPGLAFAELQKTEHLKYLQQSAFVMMQVDQSVIAALNKAAGNRGTVDRAALATYYATDAFKAEVAARCLNSSDPDVTGPVLFKAAVQIHEGLAQNSNAQVLMKQRVRSGVTHEMKDVHATVHFTSLMPETGHNKEHASEVLAAQKTVTAVSDFTVKYNRLRKMLGHQLTDQTAEKQMAVSLELLLGDFNLSERLSTDDDRFNDDEKDQLTAALAWLKELRGKHELKHGDYGSAVLQAMKEQPAFADAMAEHGQILSKACQQQVVNLLAKPWTVDPRNAPACLTQMFQNLGISKDASIAFDSSSPGKGGISANIDGAFLGFSSDEKTGLTLHVTPKNDGSIPGPAQQVMKALTATTGRFQFKAEKAEGAAAAVSSMYDCGTKLDCSAQFMATLKKRGHFDVLVTVLKQKFRDGKGSPATRTRIAEFVGHNSQVMAKVFPDSFTVSSVLPPRTNAPQPGSSPRGATPPTPPTPASSTGSAAGGGAVPPTTTPARSMLSSAVAAAGSAVTTIGEAFNSG